MSKKKNNVRQLVTLAICVSLAMVLSYVETLIPVFVPIPGVKIGLANIATVFALYTLGGWQACTVSFVRVCLSGLLFGNAVGFIYSLSGAVLSLAVMLLLSMIKKLSPIGVSVAGGVMHNAGQILAAMLVMRTAEIIAYLPVLIISGTIAGIVIGIAAGILTVSLKKVVHKQK